MAQPNIAVLTGALVARIRFDGNRAIGVEFQHQAKTVRAQATREVVLSLGAIHTPKLLMQSGIGDVAELKGAGIAVRHVLPGVGRNLHDHVALGCVWENAAKPATQLPRSQTSCFCRTRPALNAPNFYVYSHGGPDSTPENAA
jgi:choline dehydrogenase